MDVSWSATLPESGRFHGVEAHSDIEVLNDRFAALRARGEGYLEVRRAADYPVLTLGFRGSVAVIAAFVSEETMAILIGDVSNQSDLVEVPIMGEDHVFSGPAAIETERAWHLVQDFLNGRDLSELGEWFSL